MDNGNVPPEIQFLQGSIGGAIVVLMSLAVFTAVVLWARRPSHPDRIAAVWAATGTTMLVAANTGIAVIAGWWRGAFFSLPILVLFAIDGPFSIAGYTL